MVASVDCNDEEIERIHKLVDDLARPIFVLKAARGLLRANAQSGTQESTGQSRGAHTRQRNAAAQIVDIIDQYILEE